MTTKFSISHPCPEQSRTGGTHELGFACKDLTNGQSAGVQLVTLRCGRKSVDVIPTRGMGIWQANHADVRFGWDSPIQGPVHPQWVSISEPSGLGWLDGFDELMARCGLSSNGAPEFDENGTLVLPVHGRIANLPARNVEVEIDEAAGKISIRGSVLESRFHFYRLQLKTEITLHLDSDEIEIADCITNLSDRPGTAQMLYHNNFGTPVLEQGSQLFAPVKKVAPRNQHAAKGIKTWNQFDAPEASYEEQVYFLDLAADEKGHSLVMVTNADQSRGASVRYEVKNLPCFSVWKNTVGIADGYVTGLEPATNFPNPRSFEAIKGRVVAMEPGQSVEMKLWIGMLVDPAAVASTKEKINQLTPKSPTVWSEPDGNWSAP